MTWLVWRRQRVFFLVAAVAAVAVVLLRVLEPEQPDVFLRLVIEAGHLLVPLLIGGVAGLTLAAPGSARDALSFTFTQSTGRRRWWGAHLGIGVALPLVVAALATLALQTTAEDGDRLYPVSFDESGIVPVGYALFAFAVAAAAGLLMRSTVAAGVVTVVVYLALEYVLITFARPAYFPPLSIVRPLYTDTSAYGAEMGPGAWTLDSYWLDAAGTRIDEPQLYKSNGLCGQLDTTVCFREKNVVSYVTTYQPADRYWPFQIIETAILLVLASTVTAIGTWRLRRADIT